LPCPSCLSEIGLPEGSAFATPDGVTGRIGKQGRINPSTVRKAAGESFAQALTRLANTPGDESAGSRGSYARMDVSADGEPIL
jgi:hypothetical protein